MKIAPLWLGGYNNEVLKRELIELMLPPGVSLGGDRNKRCCPLFFFPNSNSELDQIKHPSLFISLPLPLHVSISSPLVVCFLKVAQSFDSCGSLSLSKDISIWWPSLRFEQITTSKGCDSPGRSHWGRRSTLSATVSPSPHCLAMLMRARAPLSRHVPPY